MRGKTTCWARRADVLVLVCYNVYGRPGKCMVCVSSAWSPRILQKNIFATNEEDLFSVASKKSR